MRKLSLQFHAMPEEVPLLFRSLIEDSSLFKVKGQGNPLVFEMFDGLPDPESTRAVSVIAFSADRPDLNAKDVNELRGKNPDLLVLEIGHPSARGLRESWLSALSDDPMSMRRWKAFARTLLSQTSGGAMAVNPRTGVRAAMKWHRFSPGALQAFRDGMPMLPVAGNSIIQLPT